MVLVAMDGLEAFNILKNSEQKISVIITNIKMPKVDGIEMLENIHKYISYPIAAIILSGMYSESMAESWSQPYTKNVIKIAILPKPAIKVDLLNAVQKALDLNLPFNIA